MSKLYLLCCCLGGSLCSLLLTLSLCFHLQYVLFPGHEDPSHEPSWRYLDFHDRCGGHRGDGLLPGRWVSCGCWVLGLVGWLVGLVNCFPGQTQKILVALLFWTERLKSLGDDTPAMLILPMYSMMPSELQSKIFEPAPPKTRKVLISFPSISISFTPPASKLCLGLPGALTWTVSSLAVHHFDQHHGDFCDCGRDPVRHRLWAV